MVRAVRFVTIAFCAVFAGGGIAVADITELQDFDKLWNYGDPAATEAKFRELEAAARERDDPDYLVQLLTQIARTKGLRGQFDEAHAILDEAGALATEACVVGGIRLKLERGRAFNSAGKKKEAIAQFLAALEAAKAAGAEFHMIDAGHMLGIAEDGDKALAWNLKAIAMAEAAKGERARGWLGPLYNNTGWTYHDKKEYEKALDLFLKGLAFRKERKQEKQVLIARWTVGRCLRSLGRFQEALATQRALLESYEKLGTRDGFVYEEIGEILWAQGNKREARSWLRGAYELLSKVDWMVKSEAARLKSLAERGGVETEAPPPEDEGK
jgi:tetratricopeptide (TPR) repeat protein